MENKDPSTLQSDWMILSYTNLNMYMQANLQAVFKQPCVKGSETETVFQGQ